MSEKIIIKNFGPITNMSFEFKKINILIGDQGTGKSTVSKLIAAITTFALGKNSSSSFFQSDQYGQKEQFIASLKIYDIEGYLTDSTTIIYSNTFFKFEFENGESSISKTKTVNGSELALDSIAVTFIPADRAAVNLLSNELLYTLNEISQDLPGYFVRFGQLFNRAKKNQEKYDFSDTLGVVYKFENNQDKIEIANKKEIRISDASSAIQTNIPLLVILSNQLRTLPFQGFWAPDLNITIIEEPELNCFPSLQNSIVRFIVRCIHPVEDEYLRRVIITTHSPYILTTLYNLIYAYQVGQKHTIEANGIIERKYWVNPKDVSAYRLLPNGICESIFDTQENLIMAEKIDEVSGFLNEQFDALLNIELVKQ